MKQKPILLCDMDGIIADFERYALRCYNKKVEFDKKLDEAKVYNYVGDKIILDESIDKKLYREDFKYEGFFYNIPPIDGAKEALTRLSEYFNICFLTTEYRSNKTCVYEKQEWLNKYFKEWADNTIFTKHKDMVYGDLLIDDSPANLKKWSDSWGGLNTVTTASLEYHWTDKEITKIIGKNWQELADNIIKHFSSGEICE